MPFSKIEDALTEIQKGKFVIVVDDEDRENEGDLIMAAEKVTPEALNFMEINARGLICVPLTSERLHELEIPIMVANNTERLQTAFTVTVDAVRGTTTGISVQDEYLTIKTLVNPKSRPEDLMHPGHIHPLQARDGGVLSRAGHTEAGVDLARLAGLAPAAVICEIKNPDGNMARVPELEGFAEEHGILIVTVAELIRYRRRAEKLITCEATTFLPTRYGNFTAYGYQSHVDDKPYVALVMGEIHDEDEVLVRIHSGCLTGDVFKSLRCDCGDQMETALQRIAKEGRGVFLYIQQEGRGIGLINKLKAYQLQDHGFDTVEANEALGFPADLRDYGIGAQILYDLGVRKMRLMTNNPAKPAGIEGYGLEIVSREPIEIKCNKYNARYLQTKQEKMGHIFKESFDLDECAPSHESDLEQKITESDSNSK